MTSHSKGEQLATYLTERTGTHHQLVSAKRSFPGVSRETWLVHTIAGGSRQGYVVRLEHPWPTDTPLPLKSEFEVQRALWEAGLPVAQPLWFDRDLDFADGRAHLIRELVDGSARVPGLRETGADGERLRRGVVFSHVESLARLHTFDWKSSVLDQHISAPASPAEALSADFDRWERLWRERRPQVRPIVTEFLSWLRPHIPTDSPRISLTKGNNGVGEEIFQNGRLVALSDFELCGLTDGVLDLAFSQGTMSLLGEGEALRHYEECTGHPVSHGRLAFAHLWNRFKSLACLDIYFLAPFLDGRDPRASAGAFGFVGLPRIERSLSKFIGSDVFEADRQMRDVGAGNYT